jgi:hypothetical protein
MHLGSLNGYTRINVMTVGQYLRWTLMSDRQQAEVIDCCSDIVTHDLKDAI